MTRQAGEGPEAAASGQTIALKAPAAGLVTRSTAVVGAMASPMPGEPLFRIAVDGEIELEAEIPSAHVPELASGQTARIEVEGGYALSGSVRLVPAAIEQRTQLGRARSFARAASRAAAWHVRPRHRRCQPKLRHLGSAFRRAIPHRGRERAAGA